MTRADFEEWKDTYASKKWFALVRELRDNLKEMLCNGSTVNPVSIEATAMQTANLTAKIEVLDEVLNFKIEEGAESE
jgi:hypothetical protein